MQDGCVNALVFEFAANGTLEQKRKGLSGRQLELIVEGALRGLVHFHSLGAVHRDLTPSNIFLDAELKAKLGDFGSGALAEALSTSNAPVKLRYVAPEVLEGRACQASDIFSLGVILYELGSGRDFPGAASFFAKRSLDWGALKKEETRRAVESCLLADPKQRPSAAELLARFDSIGWKLLTVEVKQPVVAKQEASGRIRLRYRVSGSEKVYVLPAVSTDTIGEAMASAGMEGALMLDGCELRPKMKVSALDAGEIYTLEE